MKSFEQYLREAIETSGCPNGVAAEAYRPAETRPHRSQNLLKEGEDYYSEGESIVFTASYLKRRGYCCENGCRHCPY